MKKTGKLNIKSPIDLVLKIKAKGTVFIKVFDADLPEFVFIDKELNIVDTLKVHLYFPLFSDNMVMSIESEVGFEILTATPERLRTKFLISQKDKAFLELAKTIAFLTENDIDTKIQQSGFVIEILKTIPIVNTPARIYKDKNHIQIDIERWKPITVPARVLIALHEYAHNNKNKDKSNEKEADQNALNIYLKAGFPRQEGVRGLASIFSPSKQNVERTELAYFYTLNNDF